VTTKDEWVAHCDRLSPPRADQRNSDRKILRHRSATFNEWDDSLQLDDLGYTDAKLTMLTRLYLHEETRQPAVQMWEGIRSKRKFKSVSFSTCNHIVKGGESVEDAEAKKSRIGSVQSPCMQSVIVTWVAADQVAIDVPYRSTEVFKIFPADLVFLRDVLLKPFDFSGMEMTVTCHFANVTVHPMYFVTIIPQLDDPISTMEGIKDRDPTFHRHLVTRTSHYVLPEKGASIANHDQSLRVKKHAVTAINGRELKDLRDYLRDHAL
jgi:hypothetical protein